MYASIPLHIGESRDLGASWVRNMAGRQADGRFWAYSGSGGAC